MKVRVFMSDNKVVYTNPISMEIELDLLMDHADRLFRRGHKGAANFVIKAANEFCSEVVFKTISMTGAVDYSNVTFLEDYVGFRKIE